MLAFWAVAIAAVFGATSRRIRRRQLQRNQLVAEFARQHESLCYAGLGFVASAGTTRLERQRVVCGSLAAAAASAVLFGAVVSPRVAAGGLVLGANFLMVYVAALIHTHQDPAAALNMSAATTVARRDVARVTTATSEALLQASSATNKAAA